MVIEGAVRAVEAVEAMSDYVGRSRPPAEFGIRIVQRVSLSLIMQGNVNNHVNRNVKTVVVKIYLYSKHVES